MTKMGSRAKAAKRKAKKPVLPFSWYNMKEFDFTAATLHEKAKEIMEAVEPFATQKDCKGVRIRKSMDAVMRVCISLGDFRAAHAHFFDAVAEVIGWPKVYCVQVVQYLAQGRRLYKSRRLPKAYYGTSSSVSNKLEQELVNLVDKYQTLTAEAPSLPAKKPDESVQDMINQRVEWLRGLVDSNPQKLVLNELEPPAELESKSAVSYLI